MAGRLKRYALEVAVFVAVLLAVHAYQTREHPRGPAPQVHARLLDGSSVELGGASGEPVMLHFWATWCGVCRAEEDNVQRMAQTGRVLSVASRSGSAEAIQRYMNEHRLTFPVVLDPAGSIARRYGVAAYPTSFFLASDGTIRASEAGYTTTLGLKLRFWFAGLLN